MVGGRDIFFHEYIVGGVGKAKMSGGFALRRVETCLGRLELLMSSILINYSPISVGNQQNVTGKLVQAMSYLSAKPSVYF